MTGNGNASGPPVTPGEVDPAVARMVAASMRTSPCEVLGLLDVICELLAARAVRFLVADYSLRRLQQVDVRGAVGAPQPIVGTLNGRVFTSGEILTSGTDPVVVSVPVLDGTCSIGVLEVDVDAWTDQARDLLHPLVAVFVMAWISKGLYTDQPARARRSEPLSPAAEVQWDLLPPLTCSTEDVAVSGILEPAYDLGGDSFDYAFDRSRVDFAIVDAMGHGMPAVLMSAAAINSLRNSRRAKLPITVAYDTASESIEAQFGNSHYVTAVIGSLDVERGTLSWINAGHVLPMLVRNGSFAGSLTCRPSRPLGLGGSVVEVAELTLQRGDRVLFYTDGITEARAPDRSFFGDDRLADLLVRASLENLAVQETVRHLAENVVAFSGPDLRDDATMLLLHYRPPASDG